jgi:integrase
MTAAVRDETVPVVANPCTGVKLPPVTPGHERFLTRGEVDAIVEHLNAPYRMAVLLAAGTGMRWGELAGLHWQRVNLATGLVDIVETWDPTAGQIKAYPKGKLRRAVPAPQWLIRALDQQWDQSGTAERCGQRHATGSVRCRSGLVVQGPNGAPLNGKNFGRRQWADACSDAGIDPPRLHDLRHSYASWLVQGGVQLQEVQRLLGHASSRTTERYAHLGTTQHDRVLSVLD